MKKLLKKPILLIFILLLLIPIGITFSKYIKKFVDYYILKSNNFFFSSDKLEEGGISYDINNWGGVGQFSIQFQLNNHKNNILTSDSDITYNVTATCSEDTTCILSQDSGVIYTSEKTHNLTLTVNPERTFDTDETITVTVTASSTSPYEKTLSATFNITVGRKGIDYEIVDTAGNTYLDFVITNALDQYTVDEAFDSYAVNDIISTDTYKALGNENKSKCHSASITLSFDPSKVLIDVTNNILNTATTTTTIDGISYINSITFNIDATSSNDIRFYKTDTTKDYTYPYGTEDQIINFTLN